MAKEVVLEDGYGNIIGTSGSPLVINTSTSTFIVSQPTAANLNATVVQSSALQVVHSNATIVASSSAIFTGFGTKEVNLIINVKNAPTGSSPTLQFTLQEVDPGDGSTVFGFMATTATINSAGVTVQALNVVYGSAIKVSWIVGGSSPSFTGVYATLVPKLASEVGLFDASASSSGTTNFITGTITGPAPQSALLIAGRTSTAAMAVPRIQATNSAAGNALQILGGQYNSVLPTVTDTNITFLQTNSNGELRVVQPTAANLNATVVGSGNFTVVQATAANLNATVTGTVAATQSGTWTVQPGNTANTTPWLVTDSSDGTVAAGTAATKSSLAGIVFNTALPTLTNGQQAAMQADSSGRLLVGSIASALPTGANTIGAVTQASGPWTQNITQFGGVSISTGTGASGTGIPRVTVANDSNILATQSGTWTVVQGTAASLANAWSTKITDATNGPVAVKPGNTAAVASDPALVVAISPGSPAAAGVDTVGSTGALGALNNTVIISAAGQNAVGMFLAAGTLIGTIIPEISMDGGTTWVSTLFINPITGGTNYTLVFSSSNTAQTQNIVTFGGTSNVRVRVSAYTSGTANATLRSTQIANNNNMLIGQYNSSLPTITNGYTTYLQTDSNGRVITAPAGTNASVSGFSVGSVVTSATTNTAVRASTYNEQASNAQRSFSSASANDTSAGTGARTIKVTYYDSTGAGPSTETVTLNGTTAVNTVSTTICYIESILILTAGSGGVNAGIITMFVGTGGAGGTLCTINAGDNQTIWCHHYTPTGKSTYITGLSGNNTNNSNGSILTIKAKSLSVANAAEDLVSDYVRVGGGTAQPVRQYGTPIVVVGPARILTYSACEGTASITTRASFDFYDQ